MKKLMISILAPFMLASAAYAVTYPFPHLAASQMKGDAVLSVGSRVYLFHSGKECSKVINANDILAVYREYPPDFNLESREVGKVKVLCPLGDYYFKGEVIEGEIQPGNLAKKGNIACIVTVLVKNGRQ